MSAPAADATATLAALALRVTDTVTRLRQASGVAVGCSAKRAVWSHGKTTLYRYLPLAAPAARAIKAQPLLICFALVNRPYVLDLQPDRSLVRRLLASPLERALILNVNVPDVPYERLRGYRTTRLGFRHRSEHVVQARDPRGRTVYWIGPAGPQHRELTRQHGERRGVGRK